MQIPPHSTEAEEAVIGSMFFDPAQVMPLVQRSLQVDDFHGFAQRTIYDACLGVWATTGGLDQVLAAAALRKMNRLDAVGGGAYVSHLAGHIPTASNAASYIDLVREKAGLRRIWSVCQKAHSAAGEPGADLAELSGEMCRLVESLSTDHSAGAKSMSEHVDAALERYENAHANRGTRPAGVMPIGISALEGQIGGGLYPPDLIVTAAATSGGKTALAMQIALTSALEANAQVLIASYEMSAERLTDRLISQAASVPASLLRNGMFTADQFHRLKSGTSKLRAAGIHLRDKISHWTMDDVTAEARAIKARYGLHMVVVDYIQLAAPRVVARGKQQTREREVAEMSRSLKALAKELHVPVIALSQLTDGKLRESRAIGHDADIVLIIQDDPKGRDDHREIHIDKNRDGGPRDVGVDVFWNGPLMRFA